MKIEATALGAIGLIWAAAAAAQPESQLILCAIEGAESFQIELQKPSEFGVPLNCFYAPGIYDMTACAPDGGWGLSYPSGSASLAEVTTHGMSIRHRGGMFYSRLAPTEIVAAAAWGDTPDSLPPWGPEIEGETFWSIVIDRLTGSAIIQTLDGSQTATCQAQERRF